MLGAYIFMIDMIFFLDWHFDHYVVSFLVSYNNLYFKIYFVWYEYCYSSFLLISICMEYLVPSPHFQSVCVSRSEVSLLETAYIWVLFVYHLATLCLFVGAFNPFTFKVIINMYILVNCHFVNCFGFVFAGLFSPLSSFVLFSCDLMTVLSVMFQFLFSFPCVYLL